MTGSVLPSAARPRRPIRVLVVDDSAVVRQVLTTLLGADADLAVQAAADPLIAMTKMQAARPDVIVLDLEMPRMDGMTFLRQIMATDPIPVVICSGHTGQGSEAAIQALEYGAVDVVTKPRVGLKEFLQESALALRQAVTAAARAHLERRAQSGAFPRVAPRVAPALPRPALRPTAPVDALIALGASTGGTEALSLVLSQLPADAPPVVVVQHMPAGFTRAFARRLDTLGALEVREAEPGIVLRPGLAVIAAGDLHLEVQRQGYSLVTSVGTGALVSGHRPSVDVLFRSVARAAGPHAVGVLMTGMGSDGAQGLLALRQAGAHTIAQDEASSIVFGMPREAIQLGAALEVAPLGQIAERVLRRAVGRRAGGA